jgi:hypothetical protein
MAACAVIERLSSNAVEAGFDTYEAAWYRIMALLDGRHA